MCSPHNDPTIQPIDRIINTVFNIITRVDGGVIEEIDMTSINQSN